MPRWGVFRPCLFILTKYLPHVNMPMDAVTRSSQQNTRNEPSTQDDRIVNRQSTHKNY